MNITVSADALSADLAREKQDHQKIVDDILAKVEEISGALEEEAAPSEELGKLTDKAVDLLFSTGMPQAYIPKELGGKGLFPGEAQSFLSRVAYYDGSLAWVNTIFACAGLMVSYLPEDVSEELFSGGKRISFSAVSNGQGTAVKTDDGWVVSGRYRYASAIKHATHVFMPAMKIIDGNPVPPPFGMGFFLIPIEAVTDRGNWDTIGLQATGSVDIEVKDHLIPLTHEVDVMSPPKRGGRAVSGGMNVLIPTMHLGFAIGTAERLLDEMKTVGNKKPPVPGAKSIGEKDPFRIEYAQHAMKAAAARALVDDVMESVDNTLRKGEQLSTRQSTMLRAVNIHAHDVTRDIAEWAFQRGGGDALREGRLQRIIRDTLAGCQHFFANDQNYVNVGFELMGAPDDHMWLGLFDFGPMPSAPAA